MKPTTKRAKRFALYAAAHMSETETQPVPIGNSTYSVILTHQGRPCVVDFAPDCIFSLSTGEILLYPDNDAVNDARLWRELEGIL